MTSHTTAKVSRRYAAGVGGAAGSSFLCFFGSTPSVSHAHCGATAAGSLQGCLRPRDPKSLAHASAPRCSFPTPKARGARFTFLYSFFSRPQLTAPVRADISGRRSLLPAPPPSWFYLTGALAKVSRICYSVTIPHPPPCGRFWEPFRRLGGDTKIIENEKY